jgi:hypothetical protein
MAPQLPLRFFRICQRVLQPGRVRHDTLWDQLIRPSGAQMATGSRPTQGAYRSWCGSFATNAGS